MEIKTIKNKLLIMSTAIVTLIYIIWRTFFTIPFGYGTFAVVWGIILLVVEFLGMIESFIHYKNMSNIEYPERPIINKNEYPDVDVFIATYNEQVDLLYKTVNGCVNMDYPDKSKVHIYLCDDSNRSEVKELAESFGINYITRQERTHAKAGNLNNALSKTTSPLVVTFDADMIPMHNFLTACVPYFFIENEEIGFIQTPQSFYNPDLFQYNLFSEDRIPNEQDYFYRDIQISRNKSNSVIYGGSNTVISRKALEEIGGFYTEVITEDFATGMLIQSKGYRCYAINEVHASGLSPSDLRSLVKQRERWARGCIQTGRKLNILFRKGLKFDQKLSYVVAISYWYGSFKRMIYILSPILFAVFGVVVVNCSLVEAIIFWLPMYILNNLSLKKLSNNIRNNRWTNVYETILSPLLIPTIFLETLFISKKKFSVTRKDRVDDDRKYNLKLTIPHIILEILLIIGISNCIRVIFNSNSINIGVALFWLLLNLYSVTMAIFFMLGRKMFRSTERFISEEDCIIRFKDKEIKCKTRDISEKGIAVLLRTPEYIPYDEEISIQLSSDRYKTSFKAIIVQVQMLEDDNTWKYAFKVTDINENNFRKLLSLTYDRKPTLPTNIEEHSSIFDDISINIVKRGNRIVLFNRKLARININKFVETNEYGLIKIVNFNYQYILVAINKQENKEFDKMNIKLDDTLTISCNFKKEVVNNEKVLQLFEVSNYKEISLNENLKVILLNWIKDYKVNNINNKNEEVLNEFIESNYL